jgi:16S rRNA (uracil1498-N3)-methyltransferase
MVARIYHPEKNLNVGARFFLNEAASHHVAKVLRFQIGEDLTVFNGCDQECQVKICEISKKNVEVMVLDRQEVSRESPLKIHLAQGIAKGDRWLFSLQKAVELGVEQITPLWTQHVAYKWEKKIDEKKIAQWHSIMIAACEQSGRTRIPILNPIQHFNEFVQDRQAENRIILHPYHDKNWKDLNLGRPTNVVIMIGPEGGFSESEFTMAMSHQIQGMTLGPRILRTETAVVSALSILQGQYGDL